MLHKGAKAGQSRGKPWTAKRQIEGKGGAKAGHMLHMLHKGGKGQASAAQGALGCATRL